MKAVMADRATPRQPSRVRAQRLGWDTLTTVQQWMCEQVLGIEPASEEEKPKPQGGQADKWAANLAAARQYFEREGHLQVPRKHVEIVLSEDGWELLFRLGAWVSNQRSRATPLTPEPGGAAVPGRVLPGPGAVSYGAPDFRVRLVASSPCRIGNAGKQPGAAERRRRRGTMTVISAPCQGFPHNAVAARATWWWRVPVRPGGSRWRVGVPHGRN